MTQFKIEEILKMAVELKASDVHLTVQRPPTFRINGTLVAMQGAPSLRPEDTMELARQITPDETIEQKIIENGNADFSNSFAGMGRVRVNIYIQRGSYAIAVRLIPMDVFHIDELGLPKAARELPLKGNGLILVTGPTGNGKSTTLAAMIDLLNHTVSSNIITLEDPIEYLHRHDKCIINQREVGTDCPTFAQGLRAALRQDPDIILVGEMRDLETISTAMTAAETGHLVMATLHSATTVQTIERIIDVFPPHQQDQIRVQLASTLLGIISQQLIPRVDGKGRVLACEVLVANQAVRNLIRENKTHQINTVIQTGASQGMMTMDKSLKEFYQQGLISEEEMKKRVLNPDN